MSWYSTGTVSVTNGQPTVTGVGTQWGGVLAKPGDIFRGPDGWQYEIAQVNTAAQITLGENYRGSSGSGQDYAIIPTASRAVDLHGDMGQVVAATNDLRGRLADQVTAAEAKFDEIAGRVSPGLQALIGLLPNQAGTDADGDGLPDGWYLPTNGGFTSWSLAGRSTYGAPAAIVPGSIEEQFYDGIPNNQGKSIGYRNFQFAFWRFSWDLSAGGAPDQLTVLGSARTPRGGMMGAWICEESPGVLDHLQVYKKFTRGSGGWATWYSHTEAERLLGHPGGYSHPRIQLASAGLPQRGSILIVAPQALVTRYPADKHGWGFFPGMNRQVAGNDYKTELSYITNAWEAKA